MLPQSLVSEMDLPKLSKVTGVASTDPNVEIADLYAKLCAKGRASKISQLLHKTNLKANINKPLKCSTGPLMWPPLMFACRNLNTEVIEVLLRNGADPNFCTKEGLTPIMAIVITASEGNQECSLKCAKLLAGAGVSIRLAPSFNKRTLLTRAVIKNSKSLVQYFVENNAAYNRRDENGETPLNIAIRNKFADIAKYLIEKGANPFINSSNGESSMNLAFHGEENEAGTGLVELVSSWRREYYEKHYKFKKDKFRKMIKDVNMPLSRASVPNHDAQEKVGLSKRYVRGKNRVNTTDKCSIPATKDNRSSGSYVPGSSIASSAERIQQTEDVFRKFADPFQLDLNPEGPFEANWVEAEELESLSTSADSESDISFSDTPPDSPTTINSASDISGRSSKDDNDEMRFWLIMGTFVFIATCMRYFGKHPSQH